MLVDGLVNFCLLGSVCCFVVRSLVCCGDFCLLVCLIAFEVFGLCVALILIFWVLGFAIFLDLWFGLVCFCLFVFGFVLVIYDWFWFVVFGYSYCGFGGWGKMAGMLVFEISWPGCFLWFGFSVVWVELVWLVLNLVVVCFGFWIGLC